MNTTHERRCALALDSYRRPVRDRLPYLNGLGLPLCDDRSGLATFDRPLDRAIGRRVNEDAAGRGRPLEPRRSVDDVSGRHSLACFGRGAERYQSLSGCYADSDFELPIFGYGVADRECGADCTLGIVLVCGRCAE